MGDTENSKKLAPVFVIVSLLALAVLIPSTSLAQKGYVMSTGWKSGKTDFRCGSLTDDKPFGFPLSVSRPADPCEEDNNLALVLDLTSYGLFGLVGYKVYRILRNHE